LETSHEHDSRTKGGKVLLAPLTLELSKRGNSKLKFSTFEIRIPEREVFTPLKSTTMALKQYSAFTPKLVANVQRCSLFRC